MAFQQLDHADNDYLQALARNDPGITSVEVSPHHYGSCNQYANALVGNTHVSTINVDVTDNHHGPNNNIDQAAVRTQWQAFCKAAGGLISLCTVTVLISKIAVTVDDIELIRLLLFSTRQINEIHVSCTNGIIQDNAAYSVLARCIRMHPKLNSFKLEGFSCQQQEQSLAPLLKALATVPNLNSLFLSPTCTSSNENDFVARPVIDAHYLAQLLLNCSIRRLVFASCQLSYKHSVAIAQALSSPFSKLDHLEFWRCELAALSTMLRPLNKNQALKCLVFSDNTISDYDPESNDDFLAPLASNKGLKSFNISILEQADWPRFGFLSENKKLEKLSFESRSSSSASLSSLTAALEVNRTLASLELSCHVLYAEANRHLEPLARNRGLKRMELRNNRPRPAVNTGVNQSVWPSFAFLEKNRDLEHLTLEAWRGAPQFEEGFGSLCTALCTNTSVTTLDLSKCAVQTKHIVALNRMIEKNSGLRKIDLSGGYISGPDHPILLPGLAQNRTLHVLVLTPYSRLATRIQSTCEEVAEFVQGVLKSESHLMSLEVGPCGAKHLEQLIPVMARNYRMQHLVFHQSYAFSGGNKGTESDEAKVQQKRIDIIAKLNKAGRSYLVQSGISIGSSRAGEEGPRTHFAEAAGVNVLAKVNPDVDCLFYHLRENPSLCNKRRSKRSGAPVPEQKVDKQQDRPAVSENLCNNPRQQPHHRTGTSSTGTTAGTTAGTTPAGTTPAGTTAAAQLCRAVRCLMDHVDAVLGENEPFGKLAEMFSLSTWDMRQGFFIFWQCRNAQKRRLGAKIDAKTTAGLQRDKEQ